MFLGPGINSILGKRSHTQLKYFLVNPINSLATIALVVTSCLVGQYCSKPDRALGKVTHTFSSQSIFTNSSSRKDNQGNIPAHFNTYLSVS